VEPEFEVKPHATNTPAEVQCHLESRGTTRDLYLVAATRLPLPGQVPGSVIGTITPEVDLDFYPVGWMRNDLASCEFVLGGRNNDCGLGSVSANPHLVAWHTPGFSGVVMGLPIKLAPRRFWIDVNSLGLPANAPLSVTVRAVEAHAEATIAANIVFAQSKWLFLVEPPLDVLLTNPAGKRTGMTEAGAVVTEIPGSIYVREGPSAAVLVFQPSDGDYSAEVVGSDGDAYGLAIDAVDYTMWPAPPRTSDHGVAGILAGGSGSVEFTLQDGGLVTDIDTVPPTLSLQATPSLLWPPNGKLHQVDIHVTGDDNSGAAPAIALRSVSCRGCVETRDIRADVGTDDRSVQLRASPGNVYTLTYEATDAAGNTSTAGVQVGARQNHDHHPGWRHPWSPRHQRAVPRWH
jgi:hypothetical protein